MAGFSLTEEVQVHTLTCIGCDKRIENKKKINIIFHILDSLRSLALRGRRGEGRGNWSEHEGGEGNGERGRGRREGGRACSQTPQKFLFPYTQ